MISAIIVGKIYPLKILLKTVCADPEWLPATKMPGISFIFPKDISTDIGKESLFTRWGRQRDMIQAKEGSCWVVNKIQHQMLVKIDSRVSWGENPQPSSPFPLSLHSPAFLFIIYNSFFYVIKRSTHVFL